MVAITVVMPFKNAAPYIAEAAESVLAQSFADFELLAVDDHSTDESADILGSFDDDRVRVIHSDGVGVSAAINTGIRLRSAGVDYIARHDADDISEHGRFAAQHAYLATNPQVSVLATNAIVIDDRGDRLDTFDTPLVHREIIAQFPERNPICHGSVMFNAAAVQAAGGYDIAYPLAQGYDLWVRMAQHGFRFACLAEPLYRYRRYEQSWSLSQRGLRDQLLQQIAQRAAAQSIHW